MGDKTLASGVCVLSAACALLAGGCGSSSSGPSRATYVAQANALCKSSQVQTAALIKEISSAAPSLLSGGPSAARKVAAELNILHGVAAANLAQLQALKQPSADHAKIEAFLQPIGSLVAAMSQASQALAAGQSAQALSLLNSVQPIAQAIVTTTHSYGADQCGDVVAPLA